MKFPSHSPYSYTFNNPLKYTDPTGMAPKDIDDWVERADGTIYWDENATSQATTKDGETYLGKNVIVGTHNRDADLNEPINSAQFDLYLESDKTGPSASIMGNTVPADQTKQGTLSEGLYGAFFQGRASKLAKDIDDLAVRILNSDGTDGLPTVNGNPNPDSDGLTLTALFLHSGNKGFERLWYNKGGGQRG